MKKICRKISEYKADPRNLRKQQKNMDYFFALLYVILFFVLFITFFLKFSFDYLGAVEQSGSIWVCRAGPSLLLWGDSPVTAARESRGEQLHMRTHWAAVPLPGWLQKGAASCSSIPCCFSQLGPLTPYKAVSFLLILEHVDNLLPNPLINISESFSIKKDIVVCISRVDATKGGGVITWSVFLRHPCPRTPTAEPGTSICFFAGCSSFCARQGHDTLVKWKLLAKVKFTKRVSGCGHLTGLWCRAAYLSVFGCGSSCAGSVLWKVATCKYRWPAVGSSPFDFIPDCVCHPALSYSPEE